MPEPLTADSILDTAEEVLRRYGPAKTTVVDVARALAVSHGSVYRHFPSKAALRDAVTQRWLDRVSAPLADVVAGDGPAAERLRSWVGLLAATKQGIAREDPELFATFRQVTSEAGEVVDAHVAHLAAQLARIVEAGRDDGEFAVADPAVAGLAVLQATALFHHPAHADEWGSAGLGDQLDAVLDLVLDGLRVR
ncbi:TetR/AcrR family transcriptional regulator [Nocardioides guangzhouensis]|uniref:TetR/AcrR family transcriptional regulator n=1 Tax=Nocardioides guangzhouensis TaxID=2497878 RepID=A0A4Q4Z8D4_9ACTN|nr:TetR family transcriptional regulator [Nocardioides guangzhouensis]RYP83798.1 TetR/AcrR family transcriptional regulator [Nocardioides guangzhouensis]